jgi:hypothetical protein
VFKRVLAVLFSGAMLAGCVDDPTTTDVRPDVLDPNFPDAPIANPEPGSPRAVPDDIVARHPELAGASWTGMDPDQASKPPPPPIALRRAVARARQQ